MKKITIILIISLILSGILQSALKDYKVSEIKELRQTNNETKIEIQTKKDNIENMNTKIKDMEEYINEK